MIIIIYWGVQIIKFVICSFLHYPFISLATSNIILIPQFIPSLFFHFVRGPDYENLSFVAL
jgi:hypothetical protein